MGRDEHRLAVEVGVRLEVEVEAGLDGERGGVEDADAAARAVGVVFDDVDRLTGGVDDDEAVCEEQVVVLEHERRLGGARLVGLADDGHGLAGVELGGVGDVVDGGGGEAVYPGVFRETVADASLRTVLEMDDLTDEQRASVEEIRASFERESSSLEEQWATSIREHQRGLTLDDLWGQRLASDETREISETRRELDDSVIEKLRAVLTPEQAESLPDPASTDWRRGGFGR